MRWLIPIIIIFLIVPPATAFNISEFFDNIENTITGWQIINPPIEEENPVVTDDSGGDPYYCTSKESCKEKLKDHIDNKEDLKELYERLMERGLAIPTIGEIPIDDPISREFTMGLDNQGNDIVVLYPSCKDRTPHNECSTNTPYYCNNGILEENCAVCGAKPGTICAEVTLVPLNQTNNTLIVDREVLIVNSCSDAKGICDTHCSEEFTNIPRLDDSCSEKPLLKPKPVVTGNAIANTLEGELTQKCCIPIKTTTNYTEIILENLTTNLTKTDLDRTTGICEDSSEFNKCTSEKPLFCSKFGLFNYCSKCGCPSGQLCNFISNTCIKAVEGKQFSVFKEFISLTRSEESLVDKFLSEQVLVDEILRSPSIDEIKPPVIKTEIQKSPLPGQSRIIVNIDENVMNLNVDKEGKPHINIEL